MKTYGFVRPRIDETQYVFGASSLPKIVLQADGQWDAFLPTYEPQFNSFYDSYGCTCWGTLNALEILVKKLCGREDNYSERYLYILANIRPPGGDPHVVAEVIRGNGLIPDSELPMTQDFIEFVKPHPMTPKYLEKGRNWLNAFEYKHEWVVSSNSERKNRIALIKEALQYSPVAVSVSAWNRAGEVYVDKGKRNNHWCVCYGWTEKGWKIFDSYDQSVKIYSFDASIEFAKRYHLAIKNKEEQVNIILQALQKLFQLLGFIEKNPNAKPTDEVTTMPPEGPISPATDSLPKEAPKYDWDTPVLARHSVRVICDEEGLTLTEKNLICAVIQAESGFKIKAKNENKVNGKVLSTDWGICQINDYWWIGPDKYFKSVEEVLNDPEKSVRFMIAQHRRGRIDLWSAFKNKSYQKYL